jgi:hypothetical protein
VRGARAVGGVLAFIAGLLALAGGCGETRRGTGEECLRNDDCLSGVCGSRVCAGSSPQVGSPAAPQGDDAEESDAGGTVPVQDAGPKDAKGG